MQAFLFFGGGAVVLGLVLGFAIGSTARRLLWACVVGCAVVVAALVVAIVTAPTSPEGCSHCNEYFGRWFNGLIFVVAFYNLVLLSLGAGVGSWLRRRTASAPSP